MAGRIGRPARRHGCGHDGCTIGPAIRGLRGRNRVFSWPHTIFLYAVLLHRIHQTDELSVIIKTLRTIDRCFAVEMFEPLELGEQF
jgi:hypothetical protein